MPNSKLSVFIVRSLKFPAWQCLELFGSLLQMSCVLELHNFRRFFKDVLPAENMSPHTMANAVLTYSGRTIPCLKCSWVPD
jgi:hypothetical protein